MAGQDRANTKQGKNMIRLLEFGRDNERCYLAFVVLRLDPLQLHARALIGVEITSGEALEGRGVVLDLLFVHIRFS